MTNPYFMRSAAGMLAVAAAFAAAAPVWSETTPPQANAAANSKPPGAFGPALFDKKKPIEITSDRLDVDQTAKTAIFEGKVDAIQGEIHLRADRLKVFYDAIPTPATTVPAAPGGAAVPTPPPAPAAPSGANSARASTADPSDPAASGGKIRRMDVDGHVFVSSPTETASGSNAVYSAETGKITLFGNVVLTRGGNIIRGSKLVIDVESGRSVIDSRSSAGGGRVKALFAPNKDMTMKPGTTASESQPQPQQP